MEKIIEQIKEELARLDTGEYNLFVNVGIKAVQDGMLEQYIQEVYEQIRDNEPRIERATSYTLVFLIKKYKANGKRIS